MNILVTGATGFIASQIVHDLLQQGHQVVCCARDTNYAKLMFPNATIIYSNYFKENNQAIWRERLKNIDIVINTVGILYHPVPRVIWTVHFETPRALFDACLAAKVKCIVQFSALGSEKSDTPYAKSKKAIDDYLLSLSIPAIILRPSLVYGRGSYGGMSLFRGLAGLPWFILIPGNGQQLLQPIHVEDLSKAVVRLIEQPKPQPMILTAVGPKTISFKSILVALRNWLGFTKAICLFIPTQIIYLGMLLGNLFPYSVANTSAYKMMKINNIASESETRHFHELINFQPREFNSGLFSQPSSVQDRWHARLYFLKPALRISMAFIWLMSAITSAFLYPMERSYTLLDTIGVNHFWQPILLFGASLLNGLVGLALLANFQIHKVNRLQLMVILLYTGIISITLPQLWIEPFGSVAKNIPLIVAILIMMAWESDR